MTSCVRINEANSMVIYNNESLNIYLVCSQTMKAKVRNVSVILLLFTFVWRLSIVYYSTTNPARTHTHTYILHTQKYEIRRTRIFLFIIGLSRFWICFIVCINEKTINSHFFLRKIERCLRTLCFSLTRVIAFVVDAQVEFPST